ncbi:acyl-CoA thioesterase [Arthrobacter dokdonensis]|uniref:acyl-CoA thioesterase n=1 Tax=Arthrobacter dokdonellae TaxID=2211210 RepID=UPI000DE58D3F|nr:acyl-CoA thioesterase [Arthrobacter dokdonellae]
MHLLIRTLIHLTLSGRRSPLSIWAASTWRTRAWPTDVDMAMHLNNGMYFSLMDLGRFDLMKRSGIWARMQELKWRPVVSAESIAFRKSVKLWQRYAIESRIIGLDAKAIYFEQRMVADGEIYARAYVAARLLSADGPVSNERVIEEFGAPPASLKLPEWLHSWRENNALPGSRRPAPHLWGR